MLPVLARRFEAQPWLRTRTRRLEPGTNPRMDIERQVRAEGRVTLAEQMLATGVARVFAERLGVNAGNVIGFQRILDRDFPVHRVIGIRMQKERPLRAETLLAYIKERSEKRRQAFAFRHRDTKTSWPHVSTRKAGRRSASRSIGAKFLACGMRAVRPSALYSQPWYWQRSRGLCPRRSCVNRQCRWAQHSKAPQVGHRNCEPARAALTVRRSGSLRYDAAHSACPPNARLRRRWPHFLVRAVRRSNRLPASKCGRLVE